MSYSSSAMSVTSVTSSPINLTSKLELPMTSIKTEEEELTAGGNCNTAIKRHTIDAILGLPRLGGFTLEGSMDGRVGMSTYQESDQETLGRDKEKFLNDGKVEILNLT